MARRSDETYFETCIPRPDGWSASFRIRGVGRVPYLQDRSTLFQRRRVGAIPGDARVDGRGWRKSLGRTRASCHAWRRHQIIRIPKQPSRRNDLLVLRMRGLSNRQFARAHSHSGVRRAGHSYAGFRRAERVFRHRRRHSELCRRRPGDIPVDSHRRHSFGYALRGDRTQFRDQFHGKLRGGCGGNRRPQFQWTLVQGPRGFGIRVGNQFLSSGRYDLRLMVHLRRQRQRLVAGDDGERHGRQHVLRNAPAGYRPRFRRRSVSPAGQPRRHHGVQRRDRNAYVHRRQQRHL